MKSTGKTSSIVAVCTPEDFEKFNEAVEKTVFTRSSAAYIIFHRATKGFTDFSLLKEYEGIPIRFNRRRFFPERSSRPTRQKKRR